jgi:hypothetical protein
MLLATLIVWQGGAMAEDVVHALTGIVKEVDKDPKTVVVKAADGTEQAFKYTEKTTVTGAKDAGKGVDTASRETYLTAKRARK